MIKIIFSIWMLSLISCAGQSPDPYPVTGRRPTTGVYTGGGGGRVPAGAGGLQENAPTGMVSRFDFRASVDSRSQSSSGVPSSLEHYQGPIWLSGTIVFSRLNAPAYSSSYTQQPQYPSPSYNNRYNPSYNNNRYNRSQQCPIRANAPTPFQCQGQMNGSGGAECEANIAGQKYRIKFTVFPSLTVNKRYDVIPPVFIYGNCAMGSSRLGLL